MLLLYFSNKSLTNAQNKWWIGPDPEIRDLSSNYVTSYVFNKKVFKGFRVLLPLFFVNSLGFIEFSWGMYEPVIYEYWFVLFRAIVEKTWRFNFE